MASGWSAAAVWGWGWYWGAYAAGVWLSAAGRAAGWLVPLCIATGFLGAGSVLGADARRSRLVPWWRLPALAVLVIAPSLPLALAAQLPRVGRAGLGPSLAPAAGSALEGLALNAGVLVATASIAYMLLALLAQVQAARRRTGAELRDDQSAARN